MATNLTELIAKAIKAADKRYFYEDYTAQSLAVQTALRKAGLAVVPVQATEDMVEAAKESLTYGRQRPNDMLITVYAAMVKSARPG